MKKNKQEKWRTMKNEEKEKEKASKNGEQWKIQKLRNPQKFRRFLVSLAKSSTISRVHRCGCNFFLWNPRRFPWFYFGVCLFPEENQQPVLGGHRFSQEKC